MLQFLDLKVAVPIVAFFLSEEGTMDPQMLICELNLFCGKLLHVEDVSKRQKILKNHQYALGIVNLALGTKVAVMYIKICVLNGCVIQDHVSSV